MRVIRIKKFIEEQDEINWIVDGLLPDVGWTLFYGARGIGKTTFATQLCAALSQGSPFLGRKTIKTRVLFVQADSIVAEWRAMLKRIAPKSDGYTTVEVPSKALGNPVYVRRLAEYMARFHPGFVVFDSLYNLAATTINTEGVLLSIECMKGICQTVPWMLIHHPPHNENRAAGHSSLGANCSNEWSLLKTKLLIQKGRLVSEKEIDLQRDNDGLWIPYTKGKGTVNPLYSVPL